MAPESINLRRASAEDAVVIRDLTRAAYTKWISVIGREPLPMLADYAEALRKHRFDLLYADDTLAGLIETRADPDCLLIENLAVSPDFQRRGFGVLLLKQADELTAAAGLPVLRLYTNKLFVENIRFYEKRGFHIEREEERGGGVRVYMGKAPARA